MKRKDKLNFVFFMPETLRAESLGCYGHPLVRTPNFDKLAAEGVRFGNCYAQYPICGPSRCSMMTGWYSHVTGCRTNEFFLHPHQPSLFRYLKEDGYHIEWQGKNDLYSQDYFPLAVSRSNVETRPAASIRKSLNTHRSEPIAPLGQPGYYSFLSKPLSGDPEDMGDMHLVERGMAFLRSRQPDDEPFLLYLPLALVHPPYTVPEPYYSMYDPGEVPELRGIGLPGKPFCQHLIREYHELDKLPVDIFRKINAVYLGMISLCDWIFGKLLQTLDETGLSENTAVFVFSDHGDYGGDYGLVHKTWNALEDPMVRVPLIIRIPDMARGNSVDEPVELFDVMATALDLAGIEAQHTHFARSLVKQLNGAAGDPERVVFAEGGFAQNQPHCLEYNYMDGQLIKNPRIIYHRHAKMSYDHPECFYSSVMIRTAEHKLIYRPAGESELYDMRDDPRELSNAYSNPDYASVRGELETRLLNWLIETSDVTPFERDSRATPTFDRTKMGAR